MKTPSEISGALAGLRVLDLSRVLAGPWSGQLLADLGADVVKVERPQSGDDTRSWGPPWLKDTEGRDTSEAAYYLCANRNKRSVTADLNHPDGRRIVQRLAASADILIENFKVGGLSQYGLDYEGLRPENPRLIYCSITGFGQTGPYSARPGYDFLVQGMGGLMALTGLPDGADGGGPMKAGVALVDVMTGLYATAAVLAALAHRERTGHGQHIDLALLDVQVATLANQALNFLVSGRAPQRLGNAHVNIVPYQEFPTADGHMIVAVGNDGQFSRLCAVLGRPQWSTDERFATNPRRVTNRKRLVELIREVTIGRTTDAWVSAMDAAGVPCGPINSLEKVFSDPQVRARGMRIDMDHPLGVTVPLVANPIRMSATPVAYRRAPPCLGQHTEDVLSGWLGMGLSEIAELRALNAL